jgi:hypothetical protein
MRGGMRGVAFSARLKPVPYAVLRERGPLRLGLRAGSAPHASAHYLGEEERLKSGLGGPQTESNQRLM